MKRARNEADYYALLQVGPHATEQDISAAYRRLIELYDADRMAGFAPEFQEQAVEKRRQIEAAYDELSDPQRRARYDQRHGLVTIDDDVLEYRPLPPARRQERPSPSVTSVAAAASPRRDQRRNRPSWLAPALVGAATLVVLLIIVLSGVRTFGGSAAMATPEARVGGQPLALPFSSEQITQLRQQAQQTDDFQSWAALANAQFDNLQTLRENVPQSPQYRNSLASWLDVVQAYDQALAKQDNLTIRSDRALALFNYGLDLPDQQRAAEAVSEAEAAAGSEIREPRALLNYGLILVGAQEPRVDQALAMWRSIVEIAPDAPEAQRAQALIQAYGN